MCNGAPPHFRLVFPESLEQRVSGTIDRTRGTNSTTWYFPWFKSIRFLSLRVSEVYCIYCRNQWRPGIGTKYTEYIWADSKETWNFPANQVVTVQTCDSLFWILEMWMFVQYFFLYCGITSPSVGLALHFVFTLQKSNEMHLESICVTHYYVVLSLTCFEGKHVSESC